MIKVSRGCLGEEELAEVKEAFDYGYFGLAYEVLEFEEEFKKYLGAEYAIATNTGTSALHLALDALGIGQGGEVIVPSLTFDASLSTENLNKFFLLLTKMCGGELWKTEWRMMCKNPKL